MFTYLSKNSRQTHQSQINQLLLFMAMHIIKEVNAVILVKKGELLVTQQYN